MAADLPLKFLSYFLNYGSLTSDKGGQKQAFWYKTDDLNDFAEITTVTGRFHQLWP